MATLDAFLAGADVAAHRDRDPIAWPWKYPDPQDREVVALFAASLAYGRADLIARALADATARMGPAPAAAAQADSLAAARARFDGFVYRLTRGDDLARLWLGIGHALRAHGTLGAAFLAGDPGGDDLRGALINFRALLRAPTDGHLPERKAFRHLLPDPAGASACKRWHMFLRWMVRGPDAVDFGLWCAVGPHRLTMPLDTHIHRIGRYLGLTQRPQADHRTAAEITAALRRLDPADPLRYDFALAHLGISGACPTRRVDTVCATCPIHTICRLDANGRLRAPK
ncbi:MAG: TIGR02757 family protein [Myxococcales bacterium]|nr:TIGR02757 family protein [Myxococcales bacterium]MCB9523815.1 TIGR02757 family protein [Myxococcales bacterium]